MTYYVRAYAINEKGTAYGEEKSFTTTAITVPTVITSSVNNISYTSATIDGTVTDDGGATVTERGVVYSTTPNPTTSNSKVVSGSGKGSFTCNLSNLQDGVTYYVRAFAVNQKGTAYGEEKSFTTKAIILPTVTTSPATNILYTSAIVGGNVTDDGGATITERGVVYSTTPNPTTSNSKVVSGSGKGSFTCNLSNLQDGVTYYVRAYAVNQKGTSYGEEKSFKTLLPVVTVKAKVPASWTDEITVWVWHEYNPGEEFVPTKEGDWYVYRHTEPTELNIIFKNGYGWNGFSNQTVDIVGIIEDTCIEIEEEAVFMPGYTIVDCL